jgi:hypothetical protein
MLVLSGCPQSDFAAALSFTAALAAALAGGAARAHVCGAPAPARGHGSGTPPPAERAPDAALAEPFSGPAAGLLAEAARALELLHAAGLAGLPPALSLARRLELVRVFLAAHARGRDSIALDLVPVELATPPLLRLLTRLPEPIPSIVAEYAALSPAEPAPRVVEPLVQHAATDPGRPVFVSMDGSVPAMYRQCN